MICGIDTYSQGQMRTVPHELVRVADLLYFCLLLIPLGVSREERDVCLLHVRMPGQEGCYTEIVSL